ncbi:unnamed protein product, partial [Arabidopsis halleri]
HEEARKEAELLKNTSERRLRIEALGLEWERICVCELYKERRKCEEFTS